jgi:hypothetical protein
VSGVCRSCGAAIIWTRTEADKRMPIDTEPVDRGNLILKRGHGGQYWAIVAADDTGPPRYVSHFATCPDADQHRRHP